MTRNVSQEAMRIISVEGGTATLFQNRHLLVESANSDQKGVCDQNCQNSTKNQNHPIWVEIRI